MKQVFESAKISYVEVSELLVRDYLIMVNDDENVNLYLTRKHTPYTEEQERKWVQNKLENRDPVFSLLEKKSGEFIGNIELMDVNDAEGELGIALTAAKQNMGYGTEAVTAMADYGLNVLGLKRVFLRANPLNLRAIHVYEKCGFREYQRTETHVFMEKLNGNVLHQ